MKASSTISSGEIGDPRSFATLMRAPQFTFFKKLFREFSKAEAYLVGGIVRDILLRRVTIQKSGAPNNTRLDFDFVVRGVPLVKLQEFLRAHGVVNLVGKHFGVLKFVPRRRSTSSADIVPFDIALPRTEHAFGTGGYRDVKVAYDPKLPIEEDLARRDFTVNALAYNLTSGRLIDVHGGAKDLRARLIRTVGKASQRFTEDYSRMLRALRFSVDLNFTIEPATRRELKKMMRHLNDEKAGERVVPYETIAKELLKSLVASPVETIDLWDAAGAWSEVMPELLKMKGCPQPPNFHSEGDVWKHTRLALEKLFSHELETMIKKQFPPPFAGVNPRSAEVALATLFHDIAKPLTIQTPERDGTDRIRFNEHDVRGAAVARAVCARLRLSSVPGFDVDGERISWLVAKHLLGVHGEISEMKDTTIEKYFFHDPTLGANLLLLMYADGTATVQPDGHPTRDHMEYFLRRCVTLLAVKRERALAHTLPKPLVDGNEVMEAFGIPPGPRVGKLLSVAREAQLKKKITTKAAAFRYLKRHVKDALQDPQSNSENL